RLEFRLVQETVEERIRREIADAERLEKQKYNNPMKVPPKPIEVTFADGTTREYKSKGECVTDLGVSHDGINRAINKRGGHMPKKGLRFRYLDEE
ncbi:hypothetical protein OCF16_29085, partial [Bacillus mobilis]|uniref:hypothetical protein n=1 Tax=Bacillus mobilis TaxID=2026190 RepID=UPI0021CDBA5E